jgi:4-hydroxy-3-polyprenylbenzoate decarboxylase
MAYKSLHDCLVDLEKNGHLVRVTEEVDPNLEMAAIQLRVYEMGGPALLFENVKGCEFKCASNIFGTIERSKFIFRDTFEKVQTLIDLKDHPMKALKRPFSYLNVSATALASLPKKNPFSKPVLFKETTIDKLPQIKHWSKDGGAFITLPQVYSEDIDNPGIMNANVGMYRVQLSGNDYIQNKEIGLHYQIHRGIGIHQTKANAKGQPLKVSIFVGGPPSHTLAAVMPLPEGLSEATFAGALGGRRFRYYYENGFCISTDADFVITGEIYPNETKPEGPFGDHLGYYSLAHDFPVMKVHKVYHRKNAIWPFTVVGRPPQEDTSFGALIHELAGAAIPLEIPGLKEVNAVDAAGVHPLLLAIGSERYTPYQKVKHPQELLTIANHILGSGQLSLAKFLFITADNSKKLSTHNIEEYFKYVLERIDLKRDMHFYTNTTIDTLDYSGTGLNSGSKVVFAAYGEKVRSLEFGVRSDLQELKTFTNPKVAMPGILILQGNKFKNHDKVETEIENFNIELIRNRTDLSGFPMIIIVDDSDFTSAKLNNWLWVTFTRSNPSHDIYGVNPLTKFKHFGCESVIIDARIKPNHAPVLVKDPVIEKRVDRLFEKGGSLERLQ